MTEEQVEGYKSDFNNIFKNKVNYDTESNSYKIMKIKKENEIIYTGYQINDKKVNDYELDVNIPYLNIVNETAEKYNEQIKDIFEKKAKRIYNREIFRYKRNI